MEGKKLRTGHTTSCGCAKRDILRERNTTHGRSHTAEYRIWNQMIERCTNPDQPHYALYGARGITVCDRWRASFEAFWEDMGARPGPEYSIDRKNPNGSYEPRNCRWADQRTQCNNKQDNVRLTWNGRTQTVAEWARELGMRDGVVRHRLNRGWSLQDVLGRPLRTRASLTYQGRTQTVGEWAQEMGIHLQTLHGRLAGGWTVEKALTQPVARKNR